VERVEKNINEEFISAEADDNAVGERCGEMGKAVGNGSEVVGGESIGNDE
jgi:hypothetical protein